MIRFFNSVGYRRFLLALLYVMVAAAAFNGFYTKWRLNDGRAPQSLASMVDGTAYRPYVYRQFAPAIANGIQALLPAATVERLSERLADPRRVNSRSGLAMRYPASEAMLAPVTLRYHIVYYLTFLALLGSLFAMRALCLRAGASAPAATAAPLVVALLLPFYLTEGGYFYDFFELLFMACAMLLAWRIPVEAPVRAAARLGLLAIVAAIASWNKEAFFFFAATLYPILRLSLSRIKAAGVVGILVFICGCVYLALRVRYAGNPGGTVSFQPGANLIYFLDPGNWFRTESTYGIALPKGLSAVMVLMIAGVAATGWGRLPAAFRLHVLAALAVNVQLFLLFAAEGEARNLSMLYPSLLVLMAMALTAWMKVAAPFAAGSAARA
ncbi:hypothetical protein [Achromobacter arsenitoxydans]|uniref:Glycosyltransferase RgtA/B/C/D-like domain-containing protein n=1 Tax=Achromobacter arsenitoxydans SY8 TaxID=477184 RepID=H0FD44_9BURK|nr:hypothetical protein [Achromobacter arsenitoxydans]EHK63837.1 hypothetical protein KYC_23518 [Achromobacter arsenitoxydans SY8]